MTSERAEISGPGHAVVIGASIAGLLAARALSDAFSRVTVFDRNGSIVARWGASTVSRTAPGNFIAPHGIAVDSRGALYVAEVSYTFGAKQNGVDPAEAAAHQIQKFTRRPA